jgi:hypothetical protein
MRTKNVMRHLLCGLIAVVSVAVSLYMPVNAGESGLALGPALILVREVPPGRPFTLHEAAQVRFHIENNSDEAGEFEVLCHIPIDAGIRSHEVGYEAPPQAAWFTLDKRLIQLAAHAKEEFDLQITIPDLPEHYNRHWMLYIEAGRASHTGIGATLRLRARVMLDTLVREGVGDAIGRTGLLGIDPGTAQMHVTNGVWQGQARVRNNTKEPATYDVLRLDQVLLNDQADKRARYFDHAAMATRTAWARPVEQTLTLAPGEERVVHFTTDATAALTAAVEEVLFFAHRAPAGAESKNCREFLGRLYDSAGLVRLSFAIPVPNADKKP